MNEHAMIEARNLINRVHAHGELVLKGAEALATLKNAIELLFEHTGFTLAFDPDSDPTLKDYLRIVGGRTIEGAALGAMAGFIAGALLDRPAHGVAIGAVVGGAVGAVQGLDAVARGWRVRATYLPDGTPSLHVVET